ncbi:MAG TPA: histidine kinase N-terminal 7TM domain-containing protein [Bacillota bacterium]|nr:histidine kinase N-terminal 7TM domain-containing protein [Bacillota bacterium]
MIHFKTAVLMEMIRGGLTMEWILHALRRYLPIFPAVLSILMIGYYLFKGRKTKLLYSYILLLANIAIVSAGWWWNDLASLSIPPPRLANILFNLASCYIGYCWLIFNGLYAGSRLISKKRNLWLLLIPPSLLCILILTNEYHHLLYNQLYDLFFILLHRLASPRTPNYVMIFNWFNPVYYIYILMGIVIMIKYAIKQMRNSRSLSFLLIFSAFSPLLGNLLDQLQIFMPGMIFFTPFSLLLSVILFGVVSFKYRFLNIIPVGWQKIINQMKEPIMIIDRMDTVVNYNQSFKNNFPEFIKTKSGDPGRFAELLSKRCSNSKESAPIITAIQHGAKDDFSGELTLATPEWQCFSVHVQPILSKRGEIQGRIVLFNDFTYDKKLLQELAVSQERNRIAQDFHDTLGETMTLINALLNVSIILCEQNPAEAKAKLLEARRVTIDGINELGHVIRHQTEIPDLAKSLSKLITDFEASGMQVRLSDKGMKADIPPKVSEAIYKICKEALTNALKHGNAAKATIMLRNNAQTVSLDISDNGHGCQTITKGMGLTGMDQRVKELQGNIEYRCSGEDGFNIHVEIPVV